MKMRKIKSGDWVEPVMRGYRMACCDCGLVHKMDFKIVAGRVWFRAFRDDRATAAVRAEDARGKQPKAHPHA